MDTIKALIDADYFSYAHGGATDDEGHPLAWPLVASRISQQIGNIVSKSECESYEIFLTGEGNFRESVATIKPYKGNRPSEKPFHYERIRDYLIRFRNATLIEGMEADDAVSIAQCQSVRHVGKMLRVYDQTVLCSIDKDLDMVPGWHYNWIKDVKYQQSEVECLKCFYKQLLTGDTVDNIPGLFGVGKASKLLKDLESMSKEIDMYSHVRTQYEKRFGSYWNQFLTENAILLWMLREDHDYKNTERDQKDVALSYQQEITKRLECLEEHRLTATTLKENFRDTEANSSSL